MTAAELATRIRRHGLACTERTAAMFLADFEQAGLARRTADGWAVTPRGYVIASGLLLYDELEEAA